MFSFGPAPSLQQLLGLRLVRAFLGTTGRSDFSTACMLGLRLASFRAGLHGFPSDTAEISRFPFRKFPNMPGVFDYAGTGQDSRSVALSPVAFLTFVQSRRPVGSFSQLDVPACWCRYLRFDGHLAMHLARLAVKVVRYSFLCGALSSPTFCRSPGAHKPRISDSH